MTWSYLPHTAADRRRMLDVIGVSSVRELLADIPEDLRLKEAPPLPAALAEPELKRHFQTLAGENKTVDDYPCFLGAGAYDHYIPSVIDHMLRRSEFYTAYTQYQAEISQGYLQALWEYQSMICQITGMEVANASLYDGGSAVAEAALLAGAAGGRREIVVAGALHPHYRAVLETYARDREYPVLNVGLQHGVTDLAALEAAVGQGTAAVIVQSPNFFGCVEDLQKITALAHASGALLIAVVDPCSLGVLEAPGAFGADIVVGEGQGLGLPLSFGGPYLGFFAAKAKLMRKMPGRIIGQTHDKNGRRGFVLTLQAREQHIRRDKATSNICSNEALCALAAAIYLGALGKEGYREIARQCFAKSHYAQRALTALKGCAPLFDAPFFMEFAVRLSKPAAEVNRALLDRGMIGGLDLGRYFPGMENCLLLCVTEKRSKAEIDRLVSEMEAIL